MKLSQSSKLRARLSKFHRNLKGDYSCTEAFLKEAHRRTTNIHVYKTPGTWITEGPSLAYVISDAMDTPIGTKAEIFSGDLPNELWTMVFKNLSQHDLPSCLRVSRKWFRIANDYLLWKDLNLTNACVVTRYPLGYNNATWTLLFRIENARSITVIPKIGPYNHWELGADLAAFLRTRRRNSPLPRLRSLTIRCINWDKGIAKYLPNLTELDMTGVRADSDVDLCGAIKQLSPLLKRLKLDHWRLCPGFFAVVVGFSKLEYLSISQCRPSRSNVALVWFMTGNRIPLSEAGCGTLSSLFATRAQTVMPSLKHLDFSFQDGLLFEMLHAFHVLRLQRLPAYMSSPAPDPAHVRPHSIHIDLRHCAWLRPVDLAHLQHHFPDTRTTPRAVPIFSFSCSARACRAPIERL